MSHRYRFLGKPRHSKEDQDDKHWELEGEEAFHLTKVLRLKEGTEVEVTDGAGEYGWGKLVSVSPKRAVVELFSRYRQAPPPQRLIVSIGALKPGGIDEILPALVELGIDELRVFYQADTAKARVTDKVRERWQRILVSALKQSKRAYLPELHVFESLEEMVVTAVKQPGARFLLSPLGPRSLLSALHESTVDAPTIELLIGGEKGLTAAEERRLTDLGYEAVHFGHFILRAVTCALSATAVAAQIRAGRGS